MIPELNDYPRQKTKTDATSNKEIRKNTPTSVQNRITNLYRNNNRVRDLPKLLSTFRSMWFWLMAASAVVPDVSPTASRRGELG